MRRVTRAQKPESLRRNGSRWKRELLRHLDNLSRQNAKPQRKFFERYNKNDIKKALATMYSECCCYCEGNVPLKPETAFGHVEHRKPKSVFPECTYDWDNLHWGCQACNTNKGDKYDPDRPVLDAVLDEPEEHLTYEPSSFDRGVLVKPRSRRGDTTVRHVDLNRERLIEARQEVLLGALRVIAEVKDADDHIQANYARDKLERMTTGNYGSVIRWAMEKYL